MNILMYQKKKVIIPALISIGAISLFAANPIFAETGQQPSDLHVASDFNNDVQGGKDELKHDSSATQLQNQVVDGEDGTAGEVDGQNNQSGVNEFGDIQNAENNQGVNEDNLDINNSGVDELSDSNNLNQQSQDVINEHQTQEDGENAQDQQKSATSSDNQSGDTNQ